MSFDMAVTSFDLSIFKNASRLSVLCVPGLCPGQVLLPTWVMLTLKSPLMCRLARTLLEVLNARMAVRCGLLFAPQAAIERLKAEGMHMSLCLINDWPIHAHMPIAQR